MKTTFRGETVNTQQPVPRKNQIWKNEKGDLYRVVETYKVDGFVNHVLFENEKGERHQVGCGWLVDGDNYTYVGKLSLTTKL